MKLEQQTSSGIEYAVDLCLQKQISLPPKRPFPLPFIVSRQVGISEIASILREAIVDELKNDNTEHNKMNVPIRIHPVVTLRFYHDVPRT